MYSHKYRMNMERVDLEQLVSEQIPNYRHYPKERKYRIKCPFCDHNKTPAMSVLRNLKVGICFRCETLFVNDDTVGKLEDTTIIESLDEFTRKSENGLQIFDEHIFSLFDPVKDNEFLEKRNPYVQDWNVYGIKQGKNQVITPYYMFNSLVYYQIRKYNPRGFHNPANVDAPLYIPRKRWYDGVPTVIVEGVFDSIAYDCVRQYSKKKFNICALGGKVMTNYRESLLRLLGVDRVVINLDESELSEDLKRDLRSRKLTRNIEIVPSDGPDPEEVLRAKGLKKFSEYVIPYIFKGNVFKDKNYDFVDRDLNLGEFSPKFK